MQPKSAMAAAAASAPPEARLRAFLASSGVEVDTRAIRIASGGAVMGGVGVVAAEDIAEGAAGLLSLRCALLRPGSSMPRIFACTSALMDAGGFGMGLQCPLCEAHRPAIRARLAEGVGLRVGVWQAGGRAACAASRARSRSVALL